MVSGTSRMAGIMHRYAAHVTSAIACIGLLCVNSGQTDQNCQDDGDVAFIHSCVALGFVLVGMLSSATFKVNSKSNVCILG